VQGVATRFIAAVARGSPEETKAGTGSRGAKGSQGRASQRVASSA
jgi:hypothetical protein